MTFTLRLSVSEGDLELTIDPRRSLGCPVYWPFTELHVATDRDADDMHQFARPEYVGSTHFLGDEGFVFDPASGVLTGMFLRIPENTLDAAARLQSWLSVPAVTGLPQSATRRKFSVTSPCDFRYLSTEGRYLLCAAAKAPLAGAHMRVVVHERVSLLFVEGRYCGFLLESPLRSLVRFDSSFAVADVELDLDFLVRPMQTYLRVVQESEWHLLETADARAKDALHAVLRELEGHPDTIEPVHALRDRCRGLLEDYFTG